MATRKKATTAQAADTNAGAQTNGDAVQSAGEDDDMGVGYTATVTWGTSDASQRAIEVFGGKPQAFFEMKRFGDSHTAYYTHEGITYSSDSKKGEKAKNPEVALGRLWANLPLGLDAVELRKAVDVKVPELATGNVQEPDPWTDDATDADRREALRKLGQQIHDRVDTIANAVTRTREGWIETAKLVYEAQRYIAGLSETTRGSFSVDKHRWGRYTAQFFPGIRELGPNAVGEAAVMGEAPDEVIALWPQNQTSPKSFNAWENDIRKKIATVIGTQIAKGGDAAGAEGSPYRRLIEWVEAGRPDNDPEHPKPPHIGLAEIRDFMVSEQALGLIEQRHLEAVQWNSKAQKGKDPEEKANASAKELLTRAMLTVAKWRLADLPELNTEKPKADQFSKNKLVKQVVDYIEKEYHDAFKTLQTSTESKEAERAETKAEAENVKAAFKDWDVSDAADLLFNMLNGHPEAVAVWETVQQLLVARDQIDASKVDGQADEADRGLDENATAAADEGDGLEGDGLEGDDDEAQAAE